MIKPLNTLQLSAAKNRTGLTSIGDLLPRLIKQYEMQAELARKQEAAAQRRNTETATVRFEKPTQVTFAWYE